MIVFAFDRDWTVDVNPHPRHEAVPLEWVRHLAHQTDHPVYAIGNQTLAEEAAIPGVVDIVGRHSDDWSRWLGDKQPDGRYEQFPTRRERLSLITDLHPNANDYIVVDDLDLSDVDGWTHYHAWEFVPAVEREDIRVELPPSDDSLTDSGFGAMVDRIQSDTSLPHEQRGLSGDESTTLDRGVGSSGTPTARAESILLHPKIDRIFEILCSRCRRIVLLLLHNGTVETKSDVMSQAQGEIDEVTLVHTHLPKLAEAGYVDWNRATGELSKGSCFDEIEVWLDLIKTHGEGLRSTGSESIQNG
jgi:hypothetical protein